MFKKKLNKYHKYFFTLKTKIFVNFSNENYKLIPPKKYHVAGKNLFTMGREIAKIVAGTSHPC